MPSKDSKQNFALLRDQILAQNGKEYWRSVEEFVDAPEFEEFVKQEYPVHAEEWENGLSRRNFIKVMGASLAFAGLSGCVIQPAEKIVPFVSQPENLIPGKPLFYATAMSLGGIATGLFAKSFDGRPIKVEGNPEHPGSLGATDVFAQASILNMYDPDRSQEVRNRGASSNWQNFMQAARTALDENSKDGGAGVRFLTETVTSPTLIAQFKQIATELPNSRWIQYEPVNNDNATAGAKMAFGSAAHTVYRFDQAEKILSLDADIFSGFNVRYIKDFNKGRKISRRKEKHQSSLRGRNDNDLDGRESRSPSGGQTVTDGRNCKGNRRCARRFGRKRNGTFGNGGEMDYRDGEGFTGESRKITRRCRRQSTGGRSRAGTRDQRRVGKCRSDGRLYRTAFTEYRKITDRTIARTRRRH